MDREERRRDPALGPGDRADGAVAPEFALAGSVPVEAERDLALPQARPDSGVGLLLLSRRSRFGAAGVE